MICDFVTQSQEFAKSKYGRFLAFRTDRTAAIRFAWMRGANWELMRHQPTPPPVCKAASPGWMKGKP